MAGRGIAAALAPMELKAFLSNPKQAPISIVLVLGGLAYFVATELGLVLASLNPHVAPVAPAAGLAVALLMAFGRRAWPAVTLGALAAHGLAGGGLAVALPIAAGDTLAALAGQLVLSRHLRWHGEKLPLGTTLGYAAASLLAAVISASIGLETLHLAGALRAGSGVSIWLTWWTGHALGLFLLVPALLSLLDWDWQRPNARDARRLAALLIGAVAINVLAFLDWRAGILVFASFPLVLLAFRWFPGGVGLWLANLIAALWINGAAWGFGPFVTSSENASLLNVQILAAALAFSAVTLSDIGVRGSRWIGVVFTCGAILAALAFFVSDLNRRSQDLRNFNDLIANATGELEKRIGTYTDILRGGASMFAASDSITRQEWEIYVDSIDLVGRYPGVIGMGIVVPAKHDELAAFKDMMRDDGLPMIAVRPIAGGKLSTDEHFVIIRDGPEALDHTPVGLDLASEPKRRMAAVVARDFGRPTISDLVYIARTTEPRAGFVLFVPTYFAHQPSEIRRRPPRCVSRLGQRADPGGSLLRCRLRALRCCNSSSCIRRRRYGSRADVCQRRISRRQNRRRAGTARPPGDRAPQRPQVHRRMAARFRLSERRSQRGHAAECSRLADCDDSQRLGRQPAIDRHARERNRRADDRRPRRQQRALPSDRGAAQGGDRGDGQRLCAVRCR